MLVSMIMSGIKRINMNDGGLIINFNQIAEDSIDVLLLIAQPAHSSAM